MSMRLFAASITVILLASGPALAQKFEDFKPGGVVPKDGYTPDPNKFIYVIFWHHKKLTTQFDHRAYYMNEDGVNDTTARKMKELMEQRYPNLTFYVKETNERDIKTVIDREQKRIKFIEKDWVDVKQPEKIEPPKKTVTDGRAHFGYDESATKAPAKAPAKKIVKEEKQDSSVTGTTWADNDNGSKYSFQKGGKFRYIVPKNLDERLQGIWDSYDMRWEQDGNVVKWEGRKDRDRYEGTISGKTMSVILRSDGKEYPFTLEKE